MSTQKIILFYVLFILTFSFAPTFIDNADVKADEIIWSDFWLRLKGHTKLEMEYSYDEVNWSDCRDELSIYWIDKPEDNCKKFGLEFTAPYEAYYRLTLILDYPLRSNCSINKDKKIITIYLTNYTIYLNYSDIADYPGIELGYNNTAEVLEFTIKSKNLVPQGYHMDLDPEYKVTPLRTGGLPFDTFFWLNGDAVVRTANDTYYMFYCNGTYANDIIDSARSFDGGETWYHWTVVDSTFQSYGPNAVVDSHNNVHVTWQHTGNVYYRHFNTSNNTWTGYVHISDGWQPSISIADNNVLYVGWSESTSYNANFTFSTDLGLNWAVDAQVNQENPFPTSGVKQSLGTWAHTSDGVAHYLWTGQHSGSGGKYTIRMRKYWTGNTTWSTKTINVSEPLGYAENQMYVASAVNDSDGIHITWFAPTSQKIYYRSYNYSNKSFSGISDIVSETVGVTSGAEPNIGLDNDNLVYIGFQDNAGHGQGGYGGRNVSYVYGDAEHWQKVKLSRWNGSRANIFHSVGILYSRYPYDITTGEPICRPWYGVELYYYNYTYRYAYNASVHQNGQISEIYFKSENASHTPKPTNYTYGNTSWWNPQWGYKRRVNITNPRVGCVLNLTIFRYPGNTEIRYREVSLDGSCQPDFDDIRFVTDNGDQLPFFRNPIFQYNNHSEFWINNSLNVSHFWIYWGNPSASGNSSGARTFLTYINSTNHWNKTTGLAGQDISMLSGYNGTHMYIRNNYQLSGETGFIISRNITLGSHRGGLSTPGATDNFTIVQNVQFGYPGGNGVVIEMNLQNSLAGNERVTQIRTTVNDGSGTYSIVSTSSAAARYLYNATGFNDLLTQTGSIVKNYRYVVEVNNRSRTNYYTVYNNTQKLVRLQLMGTPRTIQYPDDSAWMARYLVLDCQGLAAPVQRATNVNFTGDVYIYPKWWVNEPFISAFGDGILSVPDALHTGDAYNVEETTATLMATMVFNLSYPNECGFYVAPYLPHQDVATFNVTAGVNYSSNHPIVRYNITSLTPGEYYYVRAWYRNASGFNISTVVSYFMTKSYQPSFFRQVASGSGWVRLEWLNPTVGTGTNLFVEVRYSLNNIVTNHTDGNLGGNFTCVSGVSSSQTIYGLPYGNNINFSAFAYINGSGSPDLHQWADSYVWTSGNTSGGIFNITIRYENSTWFPMNLLKTDSSGDRKYGDDWRFDVVYWNRTETNWLTLGDWQTNISAHNWYDGWFRMNCSQTPLYFVLSMNASNYTYQDINYTTSPYMCRRVQVFEFPTFNYTFYLTDKRKVYGVSTDYIDDALAKYVPQFIDLTNMFNTLPDIDVYVEIYTYNATGVRQTIHSEFWDTSQQIRPWLLYDKQYFIGIHSSVLNISRLGIFQTGENLNPIIYINYDDIRNYLTMDNAYYIRFGEMAGDTGIYLYYYDFSQSIIEAGFRVYGQVNGTLCYGETNTSVYHNFTYPGALHNMPYRYFLWFNSSYPWLTVNFSGFFYGSNMTNITSYTRLNNTLTIIFGPTPFRSVDDPTLFVSWVHIAIFAIGCFIIFGFSGYLGELTGIMLGGWFVACGYFISGLPIGISIGVAGNLVAGASLFVFGIFIIILSVLYAYGGGKR